MTQTLEPVDLSKVDLKELYAPRKVESLGLWERDGWRLKAYGIPYELDSVREELVAAARERVWEQLPSASDPSVRGVGFVVVHDAEDGCYVLVDWWANNIEIHQALLVAERGTPTQLGPLPTPAIGCMYELGVIEFERTLWMELVRRDPYHIDLERYLTTRLQEAI